MTKPDYDIPDDVLEESMQDQLRALRNKISLEPEPGEFTTMQYARAQKPPLNRSQAASDLDRAFGRGEVTKRSVPKARRLFWRFVE